MRLSLELSWAEIAQRRVHPRSVVPEQPFERGVLRLPVVFELHAMQPFDLQRAEQGLRAGVDAPMSRGFRKQLPNPPG